MAPYRLTKFGEKRTVTKILKAGEEYYGLGGRIKIDEDCYVDVVEEFDKSNQWSLYERLWDTIRPVPPPPPKEHFWAGWFKRNKIPKATLVKG